MKKFGLLVTILLPLLFMPAFGQDSFVSVKGMTWINGLNCLMKENPTRKVSAIQLWVKVGSADENANERGTCHLIEKMVVGGSSQPNGGQFVSRIDALGGSATAYTTWDETVFGVTIPSGAVSPGLKLLFDSVLGSEITDKALEQAKQKVLQEISEAQSVPLETGRRLLFETAYTSSNYRFPLIGLKDTIEKITVKDVNHFKKKWYHPENMFLVIVGDFKTADVIGEVKRLTADLKPSGFVRPPRPIEPEQTEPRVVVRSHDRAEETILYLAFPIPPIQHPEINALDLAAEILGSGLRHHKTLGQEKGLVHSVTADTITARDPGLMVITVQLDATNVDEATRTVMEELALAGKTWPFQEELDQARMRIERREIYTGETTPRQARRIGQSFADNGDSAYWEKYLRLNRTVSPQEVSNAIAKYLVASKANLVVLVPEPESQKVQESRLAGIINEFKDKSEKQPAKENTSSDALYRTLPNGIRVVAVRDNSNPLVSFHVAFLGGKRAETSETNGIMNLMASLITKGNDSLTEEQLRATVSDMGGNLKSYSSDDSFGIAFSCFSRFTDQGLRLISDLIKNQTFPPDKLDQERKLVMQQLDTRTEESLTDPTTMLRRTLFEGHPYSFDAEGRLETLVGLTSEDLKQAFTSLAVPRNMVIACVGDIDPEKTVNMITELLGNIPDKSVSLANTSLEVRDDGKKEILLRVPSELAGCLVGFIGAKYSDHARLSLEVLENILCADDGRLSRKLRSSGVDRFRVNSLNRGGLDPGFMAFQIVCEPKQLDLVSKILSQELELVRTGLVSPEEIAKSRDRMLGNRLRTLDTSWSRAESIALNTLYDLGHDYDDQYASKLASVTPDQVRKAAQTYLDTKHCVVVRILPQESDGEGKNE